MKKVLISSVLASIVLASTAFAATPAGMPLTVQFKLNNMTKHAVNISGGDQPQQKFNQQLVTTNTYNFTTYRTTDGVLINWKIGKSDLGKARFYPGNKVVTAELINFGNHQKVSMQCSQAPSPTGKAMVQISATIDGTGPVLHDISCTSYTAF